MSKTDLGVLIFNEWFESAKVLSGLEFKKLFLAMYEYQIHGKAKPTFTAKGETIARIVFPYLERRVNGARCAKLKGRNFQDSDTTPKNADESASDPTSRNGHDLEAKEENKKEKNKIAYSPSSQSSKGETRSARVSGGKAAKSEKDAFWEDFFDEAISRALDEST